MEKYLVLILIFCLMISLHAQEKTIISPPLSPFQRIETKIGIVDIVLEYSRPSMRGRKIFGEMEPFGKVWRTGANINTKDQQRILPGEKSRESCQMGIWGQIRGAYVTTLKLNTEAQRHREIKEKSQRIHF